MHLKYHQMKHLPNVKAPLLFNIHAQIPRPTSVIQCYNHCHSLSTAHSANNPITIPKFGTPCVLAMTVSMATSFGPWSCMQGIHGTFHVVRVSCVLYHSTAADHYFSRTRAALQLPPRLNNTGPVIDSLIQGPLYIVTLYCQPGSV